MLLESKKIINSEPLCFECRAKIRQEWEEKERAMILQQIQEYKSVWHKTCGIPLRFQDKNFKNYQVVDSNRLAYDMSLNYAESFPLVRAKYESLGLVSNKIWGVGKTHLVCAIAHKIIDRWEGSRCPILYVTEPQMFIKIRTTYNHQERGETEQSIFDTMINTPLLIIDDVGKEEVADPRFVQRVWFQVINGRYDNMLPIVITANTNPDGIADHLGGSRDNEASFDRLYEMLNGVFYEIGGKSYRRG